MIEKSWEGVRAWYSQNGFAISTQPENFANIQAEGSLDKIYQTILYNENLKAVRKWHKWRKIQAGLADQTSSK